jgi:hypothetical protein
MYFAGGEYKIGPVKCLEGAESLVNPAELQNGGHLG